MGIRTCHKIQTVRIVVVIQLSHRWSSTGDCLALGWLRLLLCLLYRNPPDHLRQDLLSHLVLPEDLFLCLRLPNQASDPCPCFLAFLDQRVDVLRNSLGHNTMFFNVLFVVLEDQHHVLEVVLMDLDLLFQPIDRGVTLRSKASCCRTCGQSPRLLFQAWNSAQLSP